MLMTESAGRTTYISSLPENRWRNALRIWVKRPVENPPSATENPSVTSRCGSPLLLLTCALLMTSSQSKACVSRIPGMYASCTNTRFAACMQMSLRLLPHAIKGLAPFWPQTFIIPDDLKLAEKVMNAEVAAWKSGADRRAPCPAWIVKPSMRAGAEGMPLEQIFLVTTFEALQSKISMMHLGNTEWIMQKYEREIPLSNQESAPGH